MKAPLYWNLLMIPLNPPEDLAGFVVNVRDFGAKGDGSTDDSTSIQAALTALGDNGGCLYFPAGTYRYKQTLCVEKSNITIASDSKGQTLLYFDSQNGEAVRFDGSNQPLHHVGIRDLHVISFDAITGLRTGGYGITSQNTEDCAIKNVRVLNGGTPGYILTMPSIVIWKTFKLMNTLTLPQKPAALKMELYWKTL